MVPSAVVSGCHHRSKGDKQFVRDFLKKGGDQEEKLMLVKNTLNIAIEAFHNIVIGLVILQSNSQLFEKPILCLRELLELLP